MQLNKKVRDNTMMLSRTFLVYVLSTKSIPKQTSAQSQCYCCSKSMLLLHKVNVIVAQSQCYCCTKSMLLLLKVYAINTQSLSY